MSDDLEDPTDEPISLPDCPLCGQSVATVTVLGPMEAVAAPCGCRTPPEVLLVDPDADRDDAADTTTTDGTHTRRDGTDPVDGGT